MMTYEIEFHSICLSKHQQTRSSLRLRSPDPKVKPPCSLAHKSPSPKLPPCRLHSLATAFGVIVFVAVHVTPNVLVAYSTVYPTRSITFVSGDSVVVTIVVPKRTVFGAAVTRTVDVVRLTSVTVDGAARTVVVVLTGMPAVEVTVAASGVRRARERFLKC